MTPPRNILPGVFILFAVLALPALGAALAGRSLQELLRFPPPLEILTGYVRFSWLAVGAVVAVLVAVALPWLPSLTRPLAPARLTPPPGPARFTRFPIWGWVAIAWTLVWWCLAWTRWPWFSVLQPYTFFPIWIGFIVSLNAAIERRTGTCLLRRAPRRWLALFGASMACWWIFEWLNRFVRNWHYLGVEDFGPLAYAGHATICFSTVLPALAAIAEWLDTHPRWVGRISAGPAWPWLRDRRAAYGLLAAGILGLAGTGAYPHFFYPALWLAPLALLLGASGRGAPPGLAHELARGDWTRAATWMVAALICGFFWELWNWRSLAKWIYTVPGVERWYVFEMPLLGYAGYLAFGLECLFVTERVIGHAWASPRPRRPPQP